jgi:hypothetical protein
MISHSYDYFYNVFSHVSSFQLLLNHLNQTSQSKVVIILNEHTFKNLDLEIVFLADLSPSVSMKF